MAPLLRSIIAITALLTISACSTFGGSESASDQSGDQQDRIASLEAQIASLKADNAKLTQKLSQLQSQNDQLASVDEAIIAGETALRDPDDPRLPDRPQIQVPDPVMKRDAVIADSTSPDIKHGDVPVETAPRMVQPTFASTEAVFENESDGEIETTSVLYGVHLASYKVLENAREGWRKLQRENPDELGLLEPRVESITIQDRGGFIRLIGGGFSSKEKAAALCARLEEKGLYCAVTSFNGARLSLSETD